MRWSLRTRSPNCCVGRPQSASVSNASSLAVAGVASMTYAATNDWANAAIMTAGIALAAVGACAAVVAVKAVKTGVKVGTAIAKAAPKAERAFNAVRTVASKVKPVLNTARDAWRITSHAMEGGHHVAMGVRTRLGVARQVYSAMRNPTAVRALENGQTAFWHEASRVVAIRNPNVSCMGTAMRSSFRYFRKAH